MAQSRTAVNSKAAPAEQGSKIEPSLVPGQSITDIGGPTNKDYKADNDSAKTDSNWHFTV